MTRPGTIARAHARFWEKVSTPDENGCRNWTAARCEKGYGQFRLNGKIMIAHRVAWRLTKGRWPTKHVLHRCDNRACCEPAHLRQGTHKDNMADCAAKGRNRTSKPGNGYTKLSAADRAEIRARFADGETNKSALARDYGVTAPTIREALNG